MKSIMISIQPQWVEKICNGEKTIEIRKTMPKCELPCRVYIYCTKGKQKLVEVLRKGEIKWFGKDENDRYEENTFITRPHYDYGDTRYNMLGKVVAEFTLKEIEQFEVWSDLWLLSAEIENKRNRIREQSCIEQKDLISYLGRHNGYAWHIDNLKIYDKPKELSEFGQRCSQASEIHCRDCINNKNWDDCCNIMIKPLKRPAQSWCYIEELKKYE